MLNYASALLIIGAERPKTVLVSRRAIDGVPRGLPLGIADAPDSLPAPGRLVQRAVDASARYRRRRTREAERAAGATPARRC